MSEGIRPWFDNGQDHLIMYYPDKPRGRDKMDNERPLIEADISDSPFLQLTTREAKEIALCIVYGECYNHGTAGHNRMLLIAKLAHHIGISQRNATDLPVGNYELVDE